MMNYDEFKTKKKSINTQKNNLKKKIVDLDKQKLKIKMDHYDDQKKMILKKFNNFTAGQSNYN
jgi:hypothetical protein